MLLFQRLFCALLLTVVGCATTHPSGLGRAVSNPTTVHGNVDEIWERIVVVLNDYHFQIARESRLNGVIETDYKTGAGLLEPWHPDSVGMPNRLEGSFQPIRRRVIVRLRPGPQGGHLVSIEAIKELEDLAGLAAGSPGGATFQESRPLQRDLTAVVGQSAPSGWIAKGRDYALEQRLLGSIHKAISG